MKTSIYFILVLSLLFGNCMIGPVDGVIFTKTEFAGEFNLNNDVKATKTGTGCQKSFVGLVSLGDSGAGSVAKQNGIKKIATIDHTTMTILIGLYREYCTVVYGE